MAAAGVASFHGEVRICRLTRLPPFPLGKYSANKTGCDSQIANISCNRNYIYTVFNVGRSATCQIRTIRALPGGRWAWPALRLLRSTRQPCLGNHSATWSMLFAEDSGHNSRRRPIALASRRFGRPRGPSGRREAAGDAAHRQGLPTPSDGPRGRSHIPQGRTLGVIITAPWYYQARRYGAPVMRVSDRSRRPRSAVRG
jgi:hypothetical protein